MGIRDAVLTNKGRGMAILLMHGFTSDDPRFEPCAEEIAQALDMAESRGSLGNMEPDFTVKAPPSCWRTEGFDPRKVPGYDPNKE